MRKGKKKDSKVLPGIIGLLVALCIIGLLGCGKDKGLTRVDTSESDSDEVRTEIMEDENIGEQEEERLEPEEDTSENEGDSLPEPSDEQLTDTEPEPKTEPEQVPVMTDDSTFEIYYLDVGQGDAACVLCDGEAMLIDGGPNTESDKIYSFLKSHDVKRLNYIVATHPDADHVGGLAGALNYAEVDTVFCTVTQDDSEPFQDFLKYLGQREITVPNAGDTFYLGCSKVTILYPESDTTRNDNTSIVLRIEYGDTSFLFTGDCELGDEETILLSDNDLKSNVLKVAHHGSKNSTSDGLLQQVDPQYAVISVGGSNTYGHPTDEVLHRLNNRGVALFRTDINGAIHCSSDGKNVSFDVEKNADIDAYIAAGGYALYLEELAAKEAEQAVERSITDSDDKDEPEISYIVNTNSGKFHYPNCSSVNQMKESNKWYFTGTRDELIEKGYQPCGRCHP